MWFGITTNASRVAWGKWSGSARHERSTIDPKGGQAYHAVCDVPQHAVPAVGADGHEIGAGQGVVIFPQPDGGR